MRQVTSEKQKPNVEIVFTNYEMVGACESCGCGTLLKSLSLEIVGQRDNHEYFCVRCIGAVLKSLRLLLHVEKLSSLRISKRT
jgi:hypothetical protein